MLYYSCIHMATVGVKGLRAVAEGIRASEKFGAEN